MTRTPAWTFAAGISLGLCAFELSLTEPLAKVVLQNQISPASRARGLWFVLAGLLVTNFAVAFFASTKKGRNTDLVYWLRPLSLAFLLPPLVTPDIWRAEPLLSLVIAIAAAVFFSWSLLPGGAAVEQQVANRTPAIVWILLAALITGYASFVAFSTVRQHQLLETRAYDLGIMENVFWHTSEGRFFASSLEGRNHLGVHTSFIYLLLAPFYVLVPRPETLLVAQSLLIALSAWPLFLLARFLLRSDPAALLVSALYLLHPAIQGASFYDFHELAFAPLFFFAALYGLLRERRALLFVSVVLLLLVKEDCAIVVAALGGVALLERKIRTGVLLVGTATLSLVLFQGILIPHFAGGESSFTWYYSEMIPRGEGPSGLFGTLLLNPLYSARVALTAPKALYVLEVLGPTLLLCLFGLRGAFLVAYGLAISVFASRSHLYELGFQYPLQLVPEAFAGSLLFLGGSSGVAGRLGISPRRALLAMSLVSLFLAWHLGMLSPVSAFRGGFREVRMRYGQAERDRYREVREASALIPAFASITASETLVPHVARRQQVQTLRYAAESFGRDYDYYFILRSDLDDETRIRYRHVLEPPAYQLVRAGDYTLLYRRAEVSPPGSNEPPASSLP